MKIMITILALALGGFLSTATFANEGKVRQASQNRVVKPAANGSYTFSATGKPGDVFQLYWGGRLQFQQTYPFNNVPFIIKKVVRHSGGEYSYRVELPPGSNQVAAGGIAQVLRRFVSGSVVIDRDRLKAR